MYQFTIEEIDKLRKKAIKEPYIIEQLKEKAGAVWKEPILVPKTGIGNWELYYYCPKCSVFLTFNRQDGAHHVCPHCKTVYTGEPYDSTWWGQINRRNYTACYDLGLLYLVSQKAAYARKAADIMLEYAKYYKDYEVHGDIPYNGPGKAQAQTLDEAHLIRTFAETYDLIADILSDEEKNRICSQLLVPGMEFLKEHRNNQIHNHEVITDSAIAVVGILLDLKDDIQFALYEPYGLLYQLTHGVTQERMWFEGTFGYHFYALKSFFSFEKFAIHTNYSQIHNPIYQEMLELVLNYVHPDDSLPMMNDMNYGHGVLKDQWLYEFAYREIKSNKILKILNKIYENQTRTNIDAFFYGIDFLPEATYHCKNYHTEIGYPGHSVLHGKDGRYLLFKHDTYGGEHDHYDRLAISYLSHGERISPDLGTTGYGAVLHYDYYKNTGIHNCVTIDEENQPPQACILKRFETSEEVTYVEAEVDWNQPYQMPDSFTLVQWNEEAYRHVKIRRTIAWTDEYMVDLCLVDGVEDKNIDWAMHFCGKRKDINQEDEIRVEKFTDKKPLKYLKNVCKQKAKNNIKTSYQIGLAYADLYSYQSEGQIYTGEGPDNPSICDISYLIQRIHGKQALFFHVLESYAEKPTIQNVEFDVTQETTAVRIRTVSGERVISFK